MRSRKKRRNAARKTRGMGMVAAALHPADTIPAEMLATRECAAREHDCAGCLCGVP